MNERTMTIDDDEGDNKTDTNQQIGSNIRAQYTVLRSIGVEVRIG